MKHLERARPAIAANEPLELERLDDAMTRARTTLRRD
jgi:hypothetical protein